MALGKGPSLMFVALPKVFETMPLGNVVGAAFFVLVLFAALTSSISLMETVVSIVCDKLKIGRKMCCLVVFIGSVLIGLPSALGYGLLDSVRILGMQFLDFFDFISNSIIMPIVALGTCIFIGYVVKPKMVIDEIEENGMKFKMKKLFVIMIKYIAPICLLLIFISSVMDVVASTTGWKSLEWFKL